MLLLSTVISLSALLHWVWRVRVTLYILRLKVLTHQDLLRVLSSHRCGLGSGSLFKELLNHVVSVLILFLTVLGLWLLRRVLLSTLVLLELENLVIDLLCVLLISLTTFEIECLRYGSESLWV